MPAERIAFTVRAGVVERGKLHQRGLGITRFGNQSQQGLGDNAQRAFRAGEESVQVVAGDILDGFAAGLQDAPIRQDHGQAEHIVAGHAVFQAARTAGVAGDIPADGRMADAGRVGRVEKSHLFDLGLQVGGDDPRFGADGGVGRVDLEDVVHARQAEHDSARHRDGTGGQAGAHAARHDRYARLRCQHDHLADLLRSGGQHHHIRAAFCKGAVVTVDGQVFRCV